jgi:hypothetical protein
MALWLAGQMSAMPSDLAAGSGGFRLVMRFAAASFAGSARHSARAAAWRGDWTTATEADADIEDIADMGKEAWHWWRISSDGDGGAGVGCAAAATVGA